MVSFLELMVVEYIASIIICINKNFFDFIDYKLRLLFVY